MTTFFSTQVLILWGTKALKDTQCQYFCFTASQLPIYFVNINIYFLEGHQEL